MILDTYEDSTFCGLNISKGTIINECSWPILIFSNGSKPSINTTMIASIGAAVAAIVIVILLVVLLMKKRNKQSSIEP